jgi:hypothetical protein
MLVLARKPSESIKIGDSIIVKVIAIRGGQVKLGIEAPPGIRVIRTDSHSPNGTPSNHINGSPNGSCKEAPSNGKGGEAGPCAPGEKSTPEAPHSGAAPDAQNAATTAGSPSVKESECPTWPPAAPDTPSATATPGTPHRPIDPGAPSPDKLPGQ